MSSAPFVHTTMENDVKEERKDSEPASEAPSRELGAESYAGPPLDHPAGGSVDDVLHYMKDHENLQVDAERVDIRRLRKRIDKRIVPIMFLCYTMHFVDRSLLNYAAVMGLRQDLHLQGNDFTNAATALSIAYLIAELPNAVALQRIPAAKWLAANVVLWGISTACTAATHSYRSLLIARIFLGLFEAAIAPSLMLISSQWYTRSEQSPRFSFWYSGLGLGQIIGGLVSYGFQKVSNPSFEGWRIMFVCLGCVTVVIGLATFIILPDTPMTATFLSETEKMALLKHVSTNQTGIQNKRYKFSQIFEVLWDPQLWMLAINAILACVSSGVLSSYSSTLIRELGFTSSDAALLNIPSGVVSIIAIVAVGYGVRRTSHRWAWIVGCCVPGVVGGALMSFANGRAAPLLGIYLVNGTTPVLSVLYQWTMANCAGQTKRVVASSLIAAAFSVGTIIGPQTFQAKDAPEYLPAKISLLASQAASGFVAFTLYLYYRWINKKRDRADAANRVNVVEAGGPADARIAWGNLTDIENKTFRYVY